MRAMCVSLSLLPDPSFAFKYATPRPHCHVNVKPKFTEEESSLKIHTPLERLGKAFNDGLIHQNRPCSELGRMRFVPRDIDGAWRYHSLVPGDVSAPRWIDDKLLFFRLCMLILIKLLKEKHEKGVNGVGFVASSGVRLQPWSTLIALHVCNRQVQRLQKKKCASMPCRLFWILVSFGRWKTL